MNNECCEQKALFSTYHHVCLAKQNNETYSHKNKIKSFYQDAAVTGIFISSELQFIFLIAREEWVLLCTKLIGASRFSLYCDILMKIFSRQKSRLKPI